MRFFEVDSAVDAIMSAALLAQGRASEQNKQGKLSMTGFLQMLANSDVVIDYDGFKNIFDRTPALQNVIAQFNKDTITFKGDSDDEDAGFEAPSGEMPDDERVAKMADRAMRTREFTEAEGGDNKRAYKVVHAKKGVMDVVATSSYEAAQKFAKEKGLKSTAGVEAYLYPLEEGATRINKFTENKNCGCGKTPCITFGIQLEKFDPKHGHDSDSHVVKHKDDNDQVFYGVYNADGKITHVFYDEDKAKKFAELNHDDLMNDRFVPDGETPEEEPTGERIKDKTKKDDEPKSVKMEAEDMPPEGPEVTIGNYTTTHFFMCGSAIKTAEKHADKPGMEKLIRMLDMIYKIEQAIMEGQEATQEVKELAVKIHGSIMNTAKEIGIEEEVAGYQKMHLNSITKGDPKPGFGIVTESQYNISEDREITVRASNINYDGPALDKLPTDVNVKVMVNPGDDDEDIYDRVADELEDRYGVKVSDFEMKMMESKLPPHLSKMFGKDGKQVDTRTDVMKQMRDIVANKQAMKVKFGDGDQMIDMYTASVLTQIYDKVNDNSKEAIIQRIGTKEKFAKLMPKLFSMLGEGKYSKNPKQQAAIAIAKKKAAEAATGVPPEYGRMIVGKGPKLVKKKIGEAWQAVKEMKELYAVYDTANGNRVVGTYSSAQGAISGVRTAELPPMNIPDSNTLRIQQTRKQMMIGDRVETKSDMLRKAKKRARAELGMSERSLTKAEKGKMRSYEKKIDKADFIERYGKKEGPGIYYGTITKMAKKNA